MGSPSILGKKASRRVINTSVEEALYFDVDCVAVQIDFLSESLEENVSEISSIRMQAHKIGMPVLFMITTPKGGFKNGKEVLSAVKVCHELGADLIKTACECQNEYPEPILSSLTGIAPVVLAGGEAGEHFLTKLHKAKELGFGGYCVGRNLFQSSDPRRIFEQIEKAFG